ncbi:hypothetical protein H2J98_08320 [Corynebacterium glutamicum]|uniref:Uncharacterized protein n=1 Tax=Corynebacterium glutamicum (strain ATCC 13032 / DSM 20300 / JCM 1318 / BCRC 11384 / CCUG 27702 / LMG 3730 / NBRC 12168 / NCIMB 10025 / NRRL B-2784 / 534) TaxID=196627 RepID=Q8NPJ6_CORGL|nr:hypothetical protein [Corynebacterium glutamicum]CAF20195.1 putative secreted protein [Corynebacterium glutamicum ATCC 13032]CCH24961.1 hypothetical protein WA5_1741 [Corynebacterium glutamicum K051]ARV64079.1 hypothetical protein B7P23_03805 [Corynebacterium glutamicum]AUI01295.1 hypothetical protein CYL77_09170 [Corynebacterium glutamicum]AUI04946.1 hypothetical protein C0I99_12870 [Corynebacterium glutamicum]
MLRKASITLMISVTLLTCASPAQALSSQALSSESSTSQSDSPTQFVASIAAPFNKNLTYEQRKAIRFGPTTEQEAEQCLAKYGRDGEGPWPAIAIYPDCSFDTIEQDFYDQAISKALSVISLGSS